MKKWQASTHGAYTGRGVEMNKNGSSLSRALLLLLATSVSAQALDIYASVGSRAPIVALRAIAGDNEWTVDSERDIRDLLAEEGTMKIKVESASTSVPVRRWHSEIGRIPPDMHVFFTISSLFYTFVHFLQLELASSMQVECLRTAAMRGEDATLLLQRDAVGSISSIAIASGRCATSPDASPSGDMPQLHWQIAVEETKTAPRIASYIPTQEELARVTQTPEAPAATDESDLFKVCPQTSCKVED